MNMCPQTVIYTELYTLLFPDDLVLGLGHAVAAAFLEETRREAGALDSSPSQGHELFGSES